MGGERGVIRLTGITNLLTFVYKALTGVGVIFGSTKADAMRKNLLLFILFLGCLSLVNQAAAQLQKIFLHPKAPGSEKQSKFVDSIRFIPLEIREDIEISTYNNVTVTDKYFLVTNYSEKILLLYARNGSFVKQVPYKYLGESFYPAYSEFTNKIEFFGRNKNYTLTQKDETKIRLDWSNPRNKKYYKKYSIDLNDTTFAITKDTPEERDIVGARSFTKDRYWQGRINISPLYKDSLDFELKIYKDNQLVKGFFPYNRINETRFLFEEELAFLGKTSLPDTYFVSRPFTDTLYLMKGDSLYPAYQVVLPLENSLPPSFFTQPFKNKTERENFNRNNGSMLHQIYNFIETSQCIYLNVSFLSNYDSYVYLKESNTTLKTSRIKGDKSQYNLHLLERFDPEQHGNRYYKLQKAGDLLSFFDQNKDVPVPKELEAFMGQKPKTGAPVIVEFKLKD